MALTSSLKVIGMAGLLALAAASENNTVGEHTSSVQAGGGRGILCHACRFGGVARRICWKIYSGGASVVPAAVVGRSRGCRTDDPLHYLHQERGSFAATGTGIG